MKYLKTLLFAATVIAFNGCVLYTSTDTTSNDGLSGTLVDDQGIPVVNALVKAYSADTSTVLAKIAATTDTLSDSIADSTWTDVKGHFKFSHLKNGNYDLVGTYHKGDSTRVVSHLDIHFKGDLDVGRDTVKAPGIILISALWNGQTLPGVHCSVIGGSAAAVSDDSGRCLLANVPPGISQVHLTKNGFYTATTGDVFVRSDRITYANAVTLIASPNSISNSCWDMQQSNGFSGLLEIQTNGTVITDTIYVLNENNGDRFTAVGSGQDSSLGRDSSSQISFTNHFNFPSPSDMVGSYPADLVGYYSATLQGAYDSSDIVNGTTHSNYNTSATWNAVGTSCPQ